MHTKAVYFITFIDDHTRFTVLYAIRHKSEAFQCFLAYKAYAENATGKRLRCLRTDGGGEYPLWTIHRLPPRQRHHASDDSSSHS